MQTLTINGLTIHSANSTDFWLKEIEGLDSPDIRVSQYDRPGEDGGVVSNALYGSRHIVLNGIVQGSNAVQFEQLRRDLNDAIRLQRDANGYPQLTRLEFTTLGGKTYYCDAQVVKVNYDFDYVNWGKFMLQLIAPDSQIYSSLLVGSGLVNLPTSTGIAWPIVWPVTFGGVTGGSVEVDNDGSILTWPRITLQGQLTSPVIQNITTGQLMQLNTVLNAGDEIVLYMGDSPFGIGKRVMLNDSSSIIGVKTADSQWLGVQPGPNIFALSSGSTADTGSILVEFYPAQVGV
jgi:hypothetical protein